jgi:hypothetical protein
MSRRNLLWAPATRRIALAAVTALTLAFPAAASAIHSYDVTTGTVTPTGAATATANGGIFPEGHPTTYYFAYGLQSSPWCESSGSSGSPTNSTAPQSLNDVTNGTHENVAAPLSGLAPQAHYCAELVATDTNGTGRGEFTQFTAGILAVVSTSSFPTVGATTGRIQGTVNPEGQATKYFVDYAATSSPWCSDPTLTPPTSTAPILLGATDSTSHGVAVNLAALAPGTEYCAELAATNTSGPTVNTLGGLIMFTTTVQPPAVSTNSAMPTGATTATVGGTVNPEGQATSYYAEYDLSGSTWCNNKTGSPAHSTAPQELGPTDLNDHNVAVNLSGLTPGTEHCVDLVATNASGSSDGGQITLSPGVPVASANSATSTGPTTAEVDGTLNPTGQATTYRVEYDLAGSTWCNNKTGSPAHSTAPQELGPTDLNDHNVAVNLSGLTPGTEYCVDLVATNSSGVGASGQISLAAGVLPIVSTNLVTPTGATTSTVSGTVNPSGQSTTYYVEYDFAGSNWCQYGGGTATYSITPQMLPFMDSNTHTVVFSLAGLAAGTSYCADIIATNASGLAGGGQLGFTTLSGVPPFTYHTLTVSVAGNGSGTVLGSGVSCSGACSYGYLAGTGASLTASAAAGSTFTGWGGACSGKGACTLTMNSDQGVTAIFAAKSGQPQIVKVKSPSTKISGTTFLTDLGFVGVCPGGDATCTFTVTASTVLPRGVTARNKPKPKPLTIGEAKASVAAGSQSELTFKLNPKGAKLLRKLKSLKVTVRVGARSGSLKPITATETVTIKVPSKKPKRH